MTMGMAFVKEERVIVFSTEDVELEEQRKEEEELREGQEEFDFQCALDESWY